jgi:2-oxoglutarate ferredoxin oxidoreductase subunit beta
MSIPLPSPRDYEEGIGEGHWSAEELEEAVHPHPNEEMLREDRLPHIWCPGCGIGTTTGTFVQALKEAGVDRQRLTMVSGIGCSGRVSGYMDADSFHTTHGRAIPYALGLHVGNPDLDVVVFSGDGDLVSIGGNHLIHAARRNADITVICVNNFIYGMTGGQYGATTHTGARSTTSPYGNAETPFNVPRLVAAAGATYVARWTVLDMGRLRRSMVEALQHRGFAFIEVVSPCPIYFGRFNKRGEAIDELRHYESHTEVKNFANLDECDLSMDGKIVVGKFVDIQKPTLLDFVRDQIPAKAQSRGGN